MIVLGLSQSHRPSDAVGQWKRLKKIVLSGNDDAKATALDRNKIKLDVEDMYTEKRSNAFNWLLDMGNFFCDTLPSGTFTL